MYDLDDRFMSFAIEGAIISDASLTKYSFIFILSKPVAFEALRDFRCLRTNDSSLAFSR
jgi:hypothetical protein